MFIVKPTYPKINFDRNESVIHQDIVCWINKNLPYYRGKIIRIKNEEKNPITLMQEIGMGLRKGAADIMIRTPTALHPNIWVEFKNAKGKQSPRQKDFQADCALWGDAYMLVSCQKDFEQLCDYLFKLTPIEFKDTVKI